MARINVREYSNETNINIIPKEVMELLTLDVFNTIATNLSKSLGPLGSSTMILNGSETEATKDGYSILNKYAFNNRYKNMIYNLIKAPCTKMNNTVGDGTTTAICLTNALFNEYKAKQDLLKQCYRLPREFDKAWDEVINQLVDYVNKNATRINNKDTQIIYDLAYVSSNGNEEISKEIEDIYTKSPSPVIKEKDSPTNKSYVVPIEGFDFKCNLISDVFATNEDLSTIVDNINVLVMNYKLDSEIVDEVIIPIYKVLQAKGEKLLVIAPLYDAQLCETKLDQFIQLDRMKSGGNSHIIFTAYRTGDLKKYDLHDLCVILGCKTMTQDLMNTLLENIHKHGEDSVVEGFTNPKSPVHKFLGFAEKAILSCTTSSVFKVEKVKETKEYKDTLRRAKSELTNARANTSLEKSIFADTVYQATRRVNQLLMKNFIYYIGANSALQKQIIWDSVEDVIKCVSSAVKSGIVPGCQLTLIRGCIELKKEIVDKYEPGEDGQRVLDDKDFLKYNIIDIIFDALTKVYIMLLNGPENKGILDIIPREKMSEDIDEETLNKIFLETCQELVNNSIEKNQVFDIETLDYNPKIITSAETDTMVLTVASELVKILIEGNVCVFIDPEFAGDHDTSLEEHLYQS